MSYSRRGISLREYLLQQVEKYDSDSSSVCSEEEVGDDDKEEEEDGAQLVSAHYALAAADAPWCFTDVLPFAFSMSVFHRWRTALLGFGLGPIQHVDARFAVVHLGGVCVSLQDGWRVLLGGTLPVLPSAGGRAQPRHSGGGEDSVSTLETDVSI